MSLSRSERGEILPHHISPASANSYYSLDGIKRPLTARTSAHLVYNARPRGTHASRQPDAQHAHLPACTRPRVCVGTYFLSILRAPMPQSRKTMDGV